MYSYEVNLVFIIAAIYTFKERNVFCALLVHKIVCTFIVPENLVATEKDTTLKSLYFKYGKVSNTKR